MFQEEIRVKKVFLRQENAQCHRWMTTMAKLTNELQKQKIEEIKSNENVLSMKHTMSYYNPFKNHLQYAR